MSNVRSPGRRLAQDLPGLGFGGLHDLGLLHRGVPQPHSAIGLNTLADTLFVHYGGRGELRWWQVDLFDLGDGTYLGSLTLPVAALGTAFAGDMLYTLSSTPYPVLSAFRRRDPTTP